MIGIFILEKPDGMSQGALATEISKLIPSMILTKEKAHWSNCSHSEFFITTLTPKEILLKNAIVVASDSAEQRPSIMESATLLLCGERTSSINHKGLLITIGFGGKDTINVSSINDLDAVISVQRPIEDIYQNLIEPMEFPIKMENGNHLLDYMAIYTVALICGWRP